MIILHAYTPSGEADALYDEVLHKDIGYDRIEVIYKRTKELSPDNHKPGDIVAIFNLETARQFFEVEDFNSNEAADNDEDETQDSTPKKDLDNVPIKAGTTKVHNGVTYLCLMNLHQSYYVPGYRERATYYLRYGIAQAVYGNLPEDNTTYEWVEDKEAMQEAINKVLEAGESAFDFETNGLHHYTKPDFKVRLFTFSYKHGHSYLVPVDDKFFDKNVMHYIELLEMYSEQVCQNPAIVKWGHNVKYDMHVFNILGLGAFAGIILDTMVLAHLCFYAAKRRYGLKPLVHDLIPTLSGYANSLDANVATATIPTLAPYAATDSDATLRVGHHFMAIVNNTLDEHGVPTFVYLIRNLLVPTLYCLYDMERNGAQVDNQYRLDMVGKTQNYIQQREMAMRACSDFQAYDLTRRQKIREAHVQQLTDKIKEAEESKTHVTKQGKFTVRYQKDLEKLNKLLSGEIEEAEVFSFTSSKQLADFFYVSDYGLKAPMPYVRDRNPSKSGNKPSTKDEHLAKLADKTEVVAHLQAHRELNKILSSYLAGFDKYVDQVNRIHPNFKQARVETGRLSCTEPNLQTMPRGSSLGQPDTKEVNDAPKRMIIPPLGYKAMQFDLSAAELRVMAHMSQDPSMLAIFRTNADPHSTTAKAVANMSDEEYAALPKDEAKALRNKGKATNFLLIYDGSAKGFQYTALTNYGIGMTLEEAEQTKDNFFKAYPQITRFHKRQIAWAEKFGWVETLLGRRRQVQDIYSRDENKVKGAQRQAINTPCQGAGAEATQFIHVQLYMRLSQLIPGEFQFFNQVHDSIMVYVKEGRERLVYDTLQYIMEELNTLLDNHFHGRTFKNIALKADAEISSTNWKELEAFVVD